jgi:hypothetical protein
MLSTALQEFNRGLFDYLIATDDLSVTKKRPAGKDAEDEDIEGWQARKQEAAEAGRRARRRVWRHQVQV